MTLPELKIQIENIERPFRIPPHGNVDLMALREKHGEVGWRDYVELCRRDRASVRVS